MGYSSIEFSDLIGKTLDLIKHDHDYMEFEADDGSRYKMYHCQDCCESVLIEDICGDLQDLIGTPILEAEDVSNVEEGPLYDWNESFTWTFYKISTIKGSVTIRWYGTSNGYYSESVDFVKKDFPDEYYSIIKAEKEKKLLSSTVVAKSKKQPKKRI